MKGKMSAVLLAAFALVALTGILLPSPSTAALSLVTSRGALAGNNFIDWGVLGAEYTFVPSGTTALSNSTANTLQRFPTPMDSRCTSKAVAGMVTLHRGTTSSLKTPMAP